MRAGVGRRSLLGGAGGLLLAGVTMVAPERLSAREQAQADDDARRAPPLAGFLTAWNAGDVEGVMRHFVGNPYVVPIAGHGFISGAANVRLWVRESVRMGGPLTGQVEAAEVDRARWRLTQVAPAFERLGLPAVETLANVELRDGLIASIELRPDPLSQQRYSHAVATVTAQRQIQLPPAPATAPMGRIAPVTTSAAGWFAGTAACVAVATCAAMLKRRPS